MEKASQEKIRLFLLTDISSMTGGYAEPDDGQSLVRLLLYANQFDIEGLVATHSKHWCDAKPEYIRTAIAAYSKMWEQLKEHDPNYPDPEKLSNLVKKGDGSESGKPFVHETTEGTELLFESVEKEDSRPVWVIVWGGTTVLAQALYKAQHCKTPEQFLRFIKKLRIYAISDQDSTGGWIRKRYPELFYIRSKLSFRGMYRGGNTELVSSNWVDTHIRSYHGALGAAYPNYFGGDPWGRVNGVKEGDTPSLLYLIQNGLSDPEHPEWGSWGGRFELFKDCHYEDAKDQWDGEEDEKSTVARWREAFQNDFQARMDWCVKTYSEANHAPIVKVTGEKERSVKSGETITLDVSESIDSDGDALTFSWQIYTEAGSCRRKIDIQNDRKGKAFVTVPKVDKEEKIHIIATVTDQGEPPLSAYARFIVYVAP